MAQSSDEEKNDKSINNLIAIRGILQVNIINDVSTIIRLTYWPNREIDCDIRRLIPYIIQCLYHPEKY